MIVPSCEMCMLRGEKMYQLKHILQKKIRELASWHERIVNSVETLRHFPQWNKGIESVEYDDSSWEEIPIKELIEGKRILFCEDSIVRGTQLKDTIKRIFDVGAKEVHMRPACPPLVYSCDFLNFSRSKSELDLAARKAINKLEGSAVEDEKCAEYPKTDTKKYRSMTETIRQRLNLTSLRYQRLEDLVEAIGLPKEKLCTHCWDGSSYF